MPLLPIDLQTMFAHMNQVGREQAVQRQISPEAQALQAQNMVKRTEERDNSVNEANEVSEGVEQVKEEEEREARRKSPEDRRKPESHPDKKDFFKDPDLGRHIDISG
jgi:hypothetical protein